MFQSQLHPFHPPGLLFFLFLFYLIYFIFDLCLFIFGFQPIWFDATSLFAHGAPKTQCFNAAVALF